MMLNSKSNNKRLLLALVCGSMSYSTFAQIYSWRDADGAMHYSQFPRQIVEKNAAQSRASRKQADINDVVNDLASTKKRDNLLDGLDDIVANANVERQIEKVLTRRDPQLVLIEQQLARQQSEQHAALVAKQQVLKEQIFKEKIIKEQLALVAGTQINSVETKRKFAKNSFMAGIHKRVYGNADNKSNDVIQPTPFASTSGPDLNVIANVEAKQPRKSANKFLAGIQNKLKRQHSVKLSQPSSHIEPVVIAKTQAAVLTPTVLKPVVESRSIAKVTRKSKAKPRNAFLAGIKRKLNRKQEAQEIDEPMDLVSQKLASQNLATSNELVVASSAATGKPLRATPEQVQNKFLAEINKKLFRAHLATDNSEADNTPVATLVNSSSHSNADINGNSRRTTTVKNKELIQGADEIKAIENEISNSSQSNKAKAPSAKQVNSALMLSRLSYNQQARLPLLGTGINQLDIQGIDASSQFVNEVNRNAE
ncbi:DUF4124 domain-containing protein [Moritella dasanensis]|uniref:DUF4124 domain-containing protein n=1 Tax=Moritella dasanensis TaxID=428031 RepID=UPI0002EBDF2B|nr:DUF4124 domain-containing protein [Moritella dasanensis]